MQVPLQIAFEGIPHSDFIETQVRAEAAKLERFFDRVTSCRVVIAKPQHRHHKGDVYHLRLYIVVPGAPDVVINREPAATGAHEDVHVTIHDAFKAARRQLQDVVRKRSGKVKQHEVPPHGVVSALDPVTDHGFITTAGGREIYFHRNSVANNRFDQLHVGQKVRFSESEGDKGPQASSVQPIGKHHLD